MVCDVEEHAMFAVSSVMKVINAFGNEGEGYGLGERWIVGGCWWVAGVGGVVQRGMSSDALVIWVCASIG